MGCDCQPPSSWFHPASSRDEKPVTASLLESALTKCDARNPFRTLRLRAVSARRIHFCENCAVSPPLLNLPTFTPFNLPTIFDLSPLYSISCALFCTILHAAETQLFSFHAIPHSFAKTPGCGVTPRFGARI